MHITEDNGLEFLRKLDLEGSVKGYESTILQSSALQNVQYLNLSNTFMDPGLINDLFNSNIIKKLEYLGLANCGLPNFCMPSFRKKLNLNLKMIDLRYNSVRKFHLRSRGYLENVVIFSWTVADEKATLYPISQQTLQTLPPTH